MDRKYEAKVFIYNNTEHVSQYCIDDTKTLIEVGLGIQDIKLCHLSDTNFSGLRLKDNPIVITPGGSAAPTRGSIIETIMPHLRKDMKDEFHSIWICAGAYAAAKNISYFRTDYNFSNNGFFAPQYYLNDTDEDNTVNILSTYDAMGPFYPNNDYSFRMALKKEFKPEDLNQVNLTIPHVAKIYFSSTGKTLSQLYLQGPALVPHSSPSSSLINAYFCDQENYSFNQSKLKTIPKQNMGAVVTRPVNTKSNQGGVLACSTHPEAAVENSKLFQFFQDENRVKLSKSNIDNLKKDNKDTVESFATCMKETFGLGQ
jgi:glutamine amidotransferase-like uncharacterized protein